jgi:RND family efflux transporter MFP subunit
VTKADLSKLKIDREAKPSGASTGKIRGGVWLLRLAVLLLLVAGAIYYFGGFASGVPVETGAVTSVYPSQAFTLLNATGYVVPQTKADVASKATGRLLKLDVEEGSRVTKGQVLAELDNRDVIATMNQAAANIAVARTRLQAAEAERKDATRAFRRAEQLVRKRFVSQELYDAALARHDKAIAAVDSAKADIRAAEAAYRGAQVAVEYTLIRAPFDGVILSKNADVGDIVAPFSSAIASKGAVVSMADMETLQVEADVAESNLIQVSREQPCEIQLDALPDRRFRGAVHQIVPTVDKTKATVLVKVRFIDQDLRILPEMSAKVAFLSQAVEPEQQKPVTAVSAAAIVTRDGEDVAFVVDGDRVKRLSIVARGRIGDLVVIQRGLKPGDKVVLNPPESIDDGSRVKLPTA